MTWLRGHKTILHGERNIVLHNIENSTININSSESIDALLKEFKEYSRDCLNVFVIASTKKRIEGLMDTRNPIFLENYSDEVNGWKPFTGLNIVDIIQKATQTLMSSTIVWSIDGINETDNEKFWATLKYLKQKSILIVDGFSLNNPENKRIARVFNDYHVGGCLAVSTNINYDLKEYIDETIDKTFNHLNIYLNDYAGTLPNMHLKPKNINNEPELVNEILNISKYFLQIRTIKSKSGINIGYNQTML